jgi:hypothetical protein
MKAKAQNIPYAAALSAAFLVLRSSSRLPSLRSTTFVALSSGAVESGGGLMVEELGMGERWRQDSNVSGGLGAHICTEAAQAVND